MKPWVIGNWKQNPKSIKVAQALISDLLRTDNRSLLSQCQMMVIPSTVHLAKVADTITNLEPNPSHGDSATLIAKAAVADNPLLRLGGQDISALSAQVGAYTGDCSAAQLKDCGAAWVLIGHSERRQYYNEEEKVLQKKLQNALSEQLGVIFCVGETETQYESGDTLAVITKQLEVLTSSLPNELSQDLANRIMVAYEPVWAIGTGKVPTVEEVSTTHLAIKDLLTGFNSQITDPIVIYGGSVNADNAAQFAQAKGVDGALVGGASLKADNFLAIAQAFVK